MINFSIFFAMDFELCKELLVMVDIDQQAGLKVIETDYSQPALAELERVDTECTQKMKKIVAAYGWPDQARVGIQQLL